MNTPNKKELRDDLVLVVAGPGIMLDLRDALITAIDAVLDKHFPAEITIGGGQVCSGEPTSNESLNTTCNPCARGMFSKLPPRRFKHPLNGRRY